MGLSIAFLLLTTLLSTSHAESNIFNPIRLPRPGSAAFRHPEESLDCLSWRLAVETNNRQGWKVVPHSCKDYIEKHMKEGQYRRDCEEMAAAATEFAENFPLADDGKDVWVFDIYETTLSNLEYHAGPDMEYGTKPRSPTFYDWVKKGEAVAVPEILKLYNKVLSLGFKTVILSALSEDYKEVREDNLRKVGYDNWTCLIFRIDVINLDAGQTVRGGKMYKSSKRAELVNKGYRIVGNLGDQWSDLIGPNGGNRLFKVPNPMYYS